jgi:hypothetical protein
MIRCFGGLRALPNWVVHVSLMGGEKPIHPKDLDTRPYGSGEGHEYDAYPPSRGDL